MQEAFEKLDVWQSAKELCIFCYQLTKTFPKEEQFALTNQIRRAAISVISNIAESQSRNSVKDKTHFFNMASGSLFELKAQFIISLELEYISSSQFDCLSQKIQKTLQLVNGFIRYLKRG